VHAFIDATARSLLLSFIYCYNEALIAYDSVGGRELRSVCFPLPYEIIHQASKYLRLFVRQWLLETVKPHA
jgi:hypothetical protein